VKRGRIVAGLSGAVAGALHSLPALAYQGVSGIEQVGGNSGQAGGAAGAVSGATSVLPSTTALPPAVDVAGLVLVCTMAGVLLILVALVSIARQRRVA
jgi:hypothetical protein